MAVAMATMRLLNAWQPAPLQDFPPAPVDFNTLGFTFALTGLTSVVFGLAPTLVVVRVNLQDALKGGSRGQSAGRGAARVRRSLVTAELSALLVLMIGVGLLARTFVNLAKTDLGFRAENL